MGMSAKHQAELVTFLMKESFLRSFQEISEVTDRYNPNQKASGREGWPRWPVNDMWGMAKTRRVVWCFKADYMQPDLLFDRDYSGLSSSISTGIFCEPTRRCATFGVSSCRTTSVRPAGCPANFNKSWISLHSTYWNIYNPTKMGYDNLPINLVQDFFPSTVGVRMSRSPQLGSEMLFDEFNETKLCILQLHYIPELLSILLCHVLSMSYSWWNLRAICRLVF